MNRVRHMSALGLLFIVMLFELTAFTLLSLRDESFDPWALIFALILVALLFLQYVCVLWISRYADRFLLVIANLLAAIGMIVQYRLSPETAFRQLILYGVGLLAMFVCIGLMHRHRIFRILNWPMILGSLAILGVLLVVGKEQGGAKNWIKIGDFSFQPSEFVKVALVFVSANYLTQQKGWRDWLPSALFAILACGLLVAERDLGAALLIAEVALGRAGRGGIVTAYRNLAGRAWVPAGYLGVLTGFLVLCFYSAIGGWTLNDIGDAEKIGSISLGDVLTALSICAATNPVAEKAMDMLVRLRGCEAHASCILPESDMRYVRKLGLNLTCEPEFGTRDLYGF